MLHRRQKQKKVVLFVTDLGRSNKVFSFSEELVEFFKLKISAKGHFIFNIKIVEKLIYRAQGMPW
jgi:hypothetical protein